MTLQAVLASNILVDATPMSDVRMRWIRSLPVALTLLVAAQQAGAAGTEHTQFRWNDAAGIPHYSDTLTQDALKFGYDVLNGKGVVVKHIDRQMTAEELLAAEAQAKAAAEAKREADLQELNDQRMLAAYPTEHDLVVARQAQLDSIDHNIRSANNSLGVQERGLSDMLAQAASYEHDKAKVPENLRKQIEAQRKTVDTLRAYIERREKEKVDSTKKFEVDLVHYREARAHEAATNP